MTSALWYGQIRSSNYEALRDVYGCEPPWPMVQSPHVDLVRALAEGRDPWKTAFADYLKLTGRPDLLLERVDVLRSLMGSTGALTVDTCCNSVLDGNHRTAVALVQQREIQCKKFAPYQTIVTPYDHVEGRRFDDRWPLDYNLNGKTVLDLGARDGMNSVRALQYGADRCILVDYDFTSLTWQVLDAWQLRDRCEVRVEDVRTMRPIPCDVVLAFSVVEHIGVDCLSFLSAGKDLLLETHGDGPPPDTGHRWRWLKKVSYSRSEPQRQRNIYLGTR